MIDNIYEIVNDKTKEKNNVISLFYVCEYLRCKCHFYQMCVCKNCKSFMCRQCIKYDMSICINCIENRENCKNYNGRCEHKINYMCSYCGNLYFSCELKNMANEIIICNNCNK